MVMDQEAAALVQQLVAALQPFAPLGIPARPSPYVPGALISPDAVHVPAGGPIKLAAGQAASAAITAGNVALAVAAQPSS